MIISCAFRHRHPRFACGQIPVLAAIWPKVKALRGCFSARWSSAPSGNLPSAFPQSEESTAKISSCRTGSGKATPEGLFEPVFCPPVIRLLSVAFCASFRICLIISKRNRQKRNFPTSLNSQKTDLVLKDYIVHCPSKNFQNDRHSRESGPSTGSRS